MMSLNFPNMRNVAVGTTLIAALCGVMTSCTDDYELDEKGVSPGYISIYDLLKKPERSSNQLHPLSGSFTYYLRLAEELGYAETLKRTGSKTVFPANDEAFEAFFNDTTKSWKNVRAYEDLSETQKKLLLYGSMIDNAMLTEMLSNVQNGDNLQRGQAMKHATATSVTDSITHFQYAWELPKNNPYWLKFTPEGKGIHLVTDANRPMMVHFTREHMLLNGITITGKNSDFEVITGEPYDEERGGNYIFRNPVISPDVRALNGYVHQVRDVLFTESNVAEVIRTNGESNYFSRMLERFSVPIYNGAVTANYNSYALTNGLPTIDSIYAKRYFNPTLQIDDANNTNTPFLYPLEFDPGNNNYAPANKNALSDMCAIFVPTDKAMEEYFLPGGGGAFILEQYGKKENTVENLMENIDSIPLNLVADLVKNLMKPSFVESVPSKFGTVLNDATEPMGLSLDILEREEDGTYDIKIANNGVAYMLNTVIAPDVYQCVYAPATILGDMLIMRKAIEDGSTGNNQLGLDLNFYAYLKAMRANYALFLPTDEAFASGTYYIDPTFLKNRQPRALKFYIQNDRVFCSRWAYNPVTGEVMDSLGVLASNMFKSQLVDILNYHTVVLPAGMTLESSGNRFFKTKHGGVIEFARDENGTVVKSGAQISNFPVLESTMDPSYVVQEYIEKEGRFAERIYPEKNGTAYVINRIIQAPFTSVYSVLGDSVNNSHLSKFFDLCTDARMDRLMIWAAPEIFDGVNPITKKNNTDAYYPFIDKNGLTPNVNYFSSYNYTVYAPNNEAMDKAFNELGLPTWDDVYALYEKWEINRTPEEIEMDETNPDKQKDKDIALAMIEAINGFIRYHIQNTSIYADNTVMVDNQTPLTTVDFATAYADLLGVRLRLTLSSNESNKFTVKDAAGNVITIDANSGKLVNKMTRDYIFNNVATTANSISTSSFAVVHEISSPLVFESTNRFDGAWTDKNATQVLQRQRTLIKQNFYKRNTETIQ